MKRGILTSLAVLVAWWGAANPAWAQFGTLGQSRSRPQSFGNPAFQFNQGGNFNNPNFNTYGILRAPFDASRPGDPVFGMQRLNPDGSLQGVLDAQGVSALGGLQTGHSVTFFDTQHYFPALPYGTSMGTGTGMGGLGSQGQGQGFGSRSGGSGLTPLIAPQRIGR